MSGKHWVTQPDGYLEPQVIVTKAAASSWPAKTVIQVFHDTVQTFGERNALAVKKPVNGKVPSDWKYWTYRQYWDDCMKFARTLVYLKVGQFQVVNILGFNSPEWFIANNGSILAGCIAAGIYTTNTAEASQYITGHSKAEVVVVEGNKQLAKYATRTTVGDLPHLKAIVVWDEAVDKAIAAKCGVKVYSFDEFMVLGSSISDDHINQRWANVRPGNCSTLIYTSGTTGPPKAVMISHDNITWVCRNVIEYSNMDLNHTDIAVSYLPLSHIAAQAIDIHCMMGIGGCLYFAQPDALKGSLTHTLKDVRPTFFFGVPRVWEKIQEKMVQIGRDSTGVKKVLGTWAKQLGAERCRRLQFENDRSVPCGYSCANAIVFNNIKKALGLDRCKGCFTAAAPISVDTILYFASLDIPLYEVFGQSECTGPHTISVPNLWRIGTCGRPIKGSQTKIDPITNELCYRGRHIFMGYMYMPDKTAETIDSDGYLHSGDVATFDDFEDSDVPSPSGFMKITGRIKELIITAGGENVPPVLIEDQMKTAMVAISNVMVIGDKRKFLSMVVSLKTETDLETGLPTDTLANDSLFVSKEIGSSATTYTAAKADPLWAKYVDEGMKKANSRTTSNAQIVQKWAWLPVDFSEKAGELTPTLKLKRNVVTEKYASVIEGIYAE
eukprot:gene16834-23050_t